jgi:uroporphyrinogen-III synthase
LRRWVDCGREPGENDLEKQVDTLDGLRVVALESRMSDQTAVLIERAGGVALRAPSMREIPLEENTAALDFARKLISGQFDAVIFLTGVGAKHLAEAIETSIPAETWRAALANVAVVCRGPKPLTVMRGWGVRVDVQVPEPNTWRDILESLDQKYPVAGRSIAIQEYGASNKELIQGLIDRGVKSVDSVPVYRWALPEDLGPLKSAIRMMIEGHAGALVVTSAQQIRHLHEVAIADGCWDELKAALTTTIIVASVGPVATETLVEYGIRPDIEPEHPKLGPLLQALAKGWKSTTKRISPKAFGQIDN